ncbi:hypothetical protein NUU61_004475 [Penicillium alfredii]|uniref:Uncharacterized protein n=1 Tax=Penicillium alfredii TaxID=1506179 RepID=A0A9W9KE08_9EURO|nr:uncharacterized protein NUU61_004475 [Penicillium alfredii]KAJ5102253.1 hypothetical protein NUU61_004475 [Penicillium alfredii]
MYQQWLFALYHRSKTGCLAQDVTITWGSFAPKDRGILLDDLSYALRSSRGNDCSTDLNGAIDQRCQLILPGRPARGIGRQGNYSPWISKGCFMLELALDVHNDAEVLLAAWISLGLLVKKCDDKVVLSVLSSAVMGLIYPLVNVGLGD